MLQMRSYNNGNNLACFLYDSIINEYKIFHYPIHFMLDMSQHHMGFESESDCLNIARYAWFTCGAFLLLFHYGISNSASSVVHSELRPVASCLGG